MRPKRFIAALTYLPSYAMGKHDKWSKSNLAGFSKRSGRKGESSVERETKGRDLLEKFSVGTMGWGGGRHSNNTFIRNEIRSSIQGNAKMSSISSRRARDWCGFLLP